MRANPLFAEDDPDFVRQLIRDNPWATLVSQGDGELVASHYPVLLDEEAPELTIVTHLGRPDDQVHRLTEGELMVIVQGRHGYISPSWYPPDPGNVPTWNFSVAHLHGVPEILDETENLAVLTRLVEHFERGVEEPAQLDQGQGAKIAPRTVGIRLPVSRFVCKCKLSQNKDAATRRQVIAALRRPGPYSSPRTGRRDGAGAGLSRRCQAVVVYFVSSSSCFFASSSASSPCSLPSLSPFSTCSRPSFTLALPLPFSALFLAILTSASASLVAFFTPASTFLVPASTSALAPDSTLVAPLLPLLPSPPPQPARRPARTSAATASAVAAVVGRGDVMWRNWVTVGFPLVAFQSDRNSSSETTSRSNASSAARRRR